MGSVLLILFPFHRGKHRGLESSGNLLRIIELRSYKTRIKTTGCLLLGCVRDCASFSYMIVQGRTVLLTPPLSTTGSARKFKPKPQSHFPSGITCINQWEYSLESVTLELTPLLFAKVETIFVRVSFFFFFTFILV